MEREKKERRLRGHSFVSPASFPAPAHAAHGPTTTLTPAQPRPLPSPTMADQQVQEGMRAGRVD